MIPTRMLTAALALACLGTAPVAAQDIDVETVAVDAPVDADGEDDPREIVVIEREVTSIVRDDDADDDAGTEAGGERKVRVIRLRENAGRAELARELDALEQVDLRIVRMGEGVDLSEAELRALAENRIEAREMVVFSGREMACEKQATGTVRLSVCSSEGKASVLAALRRARGELAGDTALDPGQRAAAIAALDLRIAELEADQAE